MSKRIELKPDVLAGKPVIKGTRIPVEKIIQLLAHGTSFEEIQEDYPNLEEEDIQAALNYAAEALEEESVFSLEGDDFEVHS